MFNYYKKLKQTYKPAEKYLEKFDKEHANFFKELSYYKTGDPKFIYILLFIILIFIVVLAMLLLNEALNTMGHGRVFIIFPASLILMSLVPVLGKKIIISLFGRPRLINRH